MVTTRHSNQQKDPDRNKILPRFIHVWYVVTKSETYYGRQDENIFGYELLVVPVFTVVWSAAGIISESELQATEKTV